MSITHSAAEIMISTGGWYTASRLANELGIDAVRASGVLHNIRSAKCYETEETALPQRRVRVMKCKGRSKPIADMWRLAIFGKAL